MAIKKVLQLVIIFLSRHDMVVTGEGNDLDLRYNTSKEMLVNITATSCEQSAGCSYPWTYCENRDCVCGKIPNFILQCSTDDHSALLASSNCITFNHSKGFTELGSCIYGSGLLNYSIFGGYILLPNKSTELNKALCGDMFNRDGTLCGKCKDGYYPLSYSIDMNCVKCPNGKSNWWKFLLVAFLPLTVFYVVVITFRLNITSSHLHGFVYYSQAIAMPAFSRIILITLQGQKEILVFARILGTLYGIWNLDFLRMVDLGICLKTNTLQTLSLDLVVAVYPLMLMVLSCVLIDLYDRNFRVLVLLWKPFHSVLSLFRRNWEIKTSVIDAFATFFLLSNVKFLSVSFDLLVPVRVYQLNSSTGHLNYSLRLYYDANIAYFGPKHLPYAIPTIAVLVLFVLLPVLLLAVYPFRWFQRLLNLFPLRWHILHTFVDSFQGCYKDGTESGTRDCRWFASMFFIARIIALVFGAYFVNHMYFILVSMLLVLLATLIIQVQPFKENYSHFAYSNMMFILLLALWYTIPIGIVFGYEHMSIPFIFWSLSYITSVLPLLCISSIILHQMYSRGLLGVQFIRRLCTNILRE